MIKSVKICLVDISYHIIVVPFFLVVRRKNSPSSIVICHTMSFISVVIMPFDCHYAFHQTYWIAVGLLCQSSFNFIGWIQIQIIWIYDNDFNRESKYDIITLKEIINVNAGNRQTHDTTLIYLTNCLVADEENNENHLICLNFNITHEKKQTVLFHFSLGVHLGHVTIHSVLC